MNGRRTCRTALAVWPPPPPQLHWDGSQDKLARLSSPDLQAIKVARNAALFFALLVGVSSGGLSKALGRNPNETSQSGRRLVLLVGRPLLRVPLSAKCAAPLLGHNERTRGGDWSAAPANFSGASDKKRATQRLELGPLAGGAVYYWRTGAQFALSPAANRRLQFCKPQRRIRSNGGGVRKHTNFFPPLLLACRGAQVLAQVQA